MQVGAQEPYSFAAGPRKVLSESPAFANPNAEMTLGMYRNVMHDPSVVRGNTHSIHFLKKYGGDPEPKTETLKGKTSELGINVKLPHHKSDEQELGWPGATEKMTAAETRKGNDPAGDHKGWASRQMSNEIKNRSLLRFGPNRENREIFVEDRDRLQTNFLERLTAGIQTDPVPPKPVPKLEYTFRTGEDKVVQVVEADLFNFELEVQPKVHALVSRILEEGLHETQHETDISKLKDMKSRAIAQVKAAAVKQEQFFEGERKRLDKLGQIRQEFAVRHEEAVDVSRKMLSRTIGKDVLEPLNEDLEGFLDKFGKNIDPKLVQTSEALKDELFQGVVKVQGQLSAAKMTVKGMTEAVFGQVVGEAVRLKEEGLAAIEAKRAAEIAAMAKLLPELPEAGADGEADEPAAEGDVEDSNENDAHTD